MKQLWFILFLIITFMCSGCIVPAEIYFRNKSNSIVRLQCQLIDRRYFKRLPNEVTLYNFSKKGKSIYGYWKKTTYLTWMDSANFFIDVPPNTIVDLEDVTDKFSLGLPFPDVLVIAKTKDKIDTLAKGISYDLLFSKFKEKKRFLGKSIFYYDFN